MSRITVIRVRGIGPNYVHFLQRSLSKTFRETESDLVYLCAQQSSSIWRKMKSTHNMVFQKKREKGASNVTAVTESIIQPISRTPYTYTIYLQIAFFSLLFILFQILFLCRVFWCRIPFRFMWRYRYSRKWAPSYFSWCSVTQWPSTIHPSSPSPLKWAWKIKAEERDGVFRTNQCVYVSWKGKCCTRELRPMKPHSCLHAAGTASFTKPIVMASTSSPTWAVKWAFPSWKCWNLTPTGNVWASWYVTLFDWLIDCSFVRSFVRLNDWLVDWYFIRNFSVFI